MERRVIDKFKCGEGVMEVFEYCVRGLVGIIEIFFYIGIEYSCEEIVGYILVVFNGL